MNRKNRHIDIELNTKEDLIEVLEGICETKSCILRKYGVDSKEELLALVSRSKISYWDVSMDLLRLNILDEMEKTVLEMLKKPIEHSIWNTILGFMKKTLLFARKDVKEAST